MQVWLSGRPPVRLDGDTLAPDTQLMLALLARVGGPSIPELGPVQARLRRRWMAAVVGGAPVPVGAVSGVLIDGPAGPLAARHYVPAEGGEGLPLLVFYHGGGFVFGDLDTHDGLCRLLCRHGGAHVLAIDYRLAPEHPFPAALDDAQAAFRWALANAERLGADPLRVAVAGDSAGGNLAAVVSQLAARAGEPIPAMQLLIYPVTDLVNRRRSRELFGEGFFLTDAEMDWFRAQYLGAEQGLEADPRISPLLSEDLAGLPPALVVTAAFDPLRDEGEDYAGQLRAAGNYVLLRRVPGVVHGFASAGGASRRSRDAVVELAGATRAMLARPVPAGVGGGAEAI